jgi:hypothetical protein
MTTYDLAIASISSHLNCEEGHIKTVLKHENAVIFFMLWASVESKHFLTRANFDLLKAFSKEHHESFYNLNIKSIESTFDYFFNRYQNDVLRQNLLNCNGRSNGKLDIFFAETIAKPNTNEYEKVLFILCVVFRFRNNIFHGVKEFKKWSDYSEPIGHCNAVLSQLLNFSTNP